MRRLRACCRGESPDQVRELIERPFRFEVDIARALDFLGECEQPSRGYPDHVEQESGIARRRDAEFLEFTQGLHDDFKQRLKVIRDQPVESCGRMAGFLQDELVQRRLTVRIANVRPYERLGASPGFLFRYVRHCLDQRNIEFAKDTVSGCPP